jgi:hypothetical protein
MTISSMVRQRNEVNSVSLNISIFVATSAPLVTIKELVEQRLQTQFVRRTDVEFSLFEGKVDDIFISLFDEHGLEDDCGIQFGLFQIEIDLTHKYDESLCVQLAELVAKDLATQLHCRTIVVRNLQRILAHFGREVEDK